MKLSDIKLGDTVYLVQKKVRRDNLTPLYMEFEGIRWKQVTGPIFYYESEKTLLIRIFKYNVMDNILPGYEEEVDSYCIEPDEYTFFVVDAANVLSIIVYNSGDEEIEVFAAEAEALEYVEKMNVALSKKA